MTHWKPLSLSRFPAGRSWIEHLESLALSVVEVPTGTVLWHGVEHGGQFDLQSRRLKDRQWFSVDREIARSYGAKPGFLLGYETRRITSCVEIAQRKLLEHPATARLVKEFRLGGGVPPKVSQWDVDEVAVKRWYLLDAIRLAVGRNDIDGFFDNPEPEREFYFRDLSSTIEIRSCTTLSTDA